MSYLREQYYNNALSKNRKFYGIQSHILATYPQTLYVLCASRSLNTEIRNTVSMK